MQAHQHLDPAPAAGQREQPVRRIEDRCAGERHGLAEAAVRVPGRERALADDFARLRHRGEELLLVGRTLGDRHRQIDVADLAEEQTRGRAG
jgi:hypothetical protein